MHRHLHFMSSSGSSSYNIWQRSFTLPSSFLGGPCQVLTPHNFGMNPDPPCQWVIHPAKVKTVVSPLYYLLKTHQSYKNKHMGAILDTSTSCKITVSYNIQQNCRTPCQVLHSPCQTIGISLPRNILVEPCQGLISILLHLVTSF